MIGWLGTGRSFDDLIEGVAVRTIKKLSARCHDTLHTLTGSKAYIFDRLQAMSGDTVTRP
jgi:hypothetical protein